ncbi:MAG: histidine phosphatase family protein [Thiobacillus sp. 63-78]|uniref:histidine phosphatase family protein n=1 Tax=Thiobacillus sp. 63-78 TaxID=1895859 RepID=UPI000960AA19|nr:histidine phosphatase family protein [Thiobacillus sp. 63-78]MBN8763064.1 histidine phosphatase family protein [Thiobacillus sp.]MBN8774073.1 histidine phosphatase family protein [Thiobacillus sp.]OJZ16915.1 MAG: histidine phosphatase family protein [Thiobacillus sp. 63-78]
MRMVFLRHGESEYNLRGLCNADPAVPVPLTPKGRLQAAAAAQRLRNVPIRRVYVSRLTRARETAAIVNASHGADVYVDGRLDDRNTGYEGKPVANYLSAMRRAADPFSWKAPAGESYVEMVGRVHDFLEEIEHDDTSTVLVVAHHEVLQAVTGHFRELSLPEMWSVWVEHCEVLEFESA